MDSAEREWLVQHLDEQARALAEMTASAREHHDPSAELAGVRDQIFVMRETLETLDVPHATATHAEWHRAIGTDLP